MSSSVTFSYSKVKTVKIFIPAVLQEFFFFFLKLLVHVKPAVLKWLLTFFTIRVSVIGFPETSSALDECPARCDPQP